MSQTTQFDRLMAAVASGSDEAVWELAETYTPYIIRAVRHTLSPKLRQKLDSMDFAQTLWASLLLRPSHFLQLQNSEELIRYLVAATRKKVFEKARSYKSQRRDIGREEVLDCHTSGRNPKRTGFSDGLYSRESSPSTTAMIRDQWRHILSTASERDREILRLRRSGHSFGEIAGILQIYESTARRAMRRLIEQLAN